MKSWVRDWSALPWPVLYSPDGRHVLLWTADKWWRGWDVAAKKDTEAFSKVANRPGLIAILPGARQVVNSASHAFTVLDVATGEEVRRIPWEGKLNDQDAILGDLSADGRRILTAHKDETVRLYEERTGRFNELGRINFDHKVGPRGPLGHEARLCFSADGRYAAAASVDGYLIVLRLPDPPAAKDKP
jgi:WD40 repeat protein